MARAPLVSAIVLNYRSPQDTVLCVRALLSQTVADRMEILVADNHSGDDSIGVIRNHFGRVPGVRVIETPLNLGYGQGNAYAMRYAGGEFVLIINPDNILEPGGLERMVSFMQQHPDVGIVAPQLVYPDGALRPSFRRFPRWRDVIAKRSILDRLWPGAVNAYLMRDADPSATLDVDWVVGACILMRTEVFRNLGGFDPRFFLFFEDTDLCRRCRDAGMRVVYLPETRALDRKGRLSEGGFWSLLSSNIGRIHIASACRYFWKWRGALR